MAKVSVIVPNYNHASFLRQRLESILNQTYQDFELIILDDYSTDNSREVIESYREHPKVSHILYNSQNSGSPFIQWKKGIDLAIGEYIWIAESDDWAESGLIESLLPHIEKDKDVVLAFCNSMTINEKNEEISAWKDSWVNSIKEDELVVASGNKLIEEYFIYCNVIPNASATIFRKKDINLSFLEGIKMKLNGDWLFWIQMIKGKKLVFKNRISNYFRCHSSSVRSKVVKNGLNLVEYFQVLNYIEMENPSTRPLISVQKEIVFRDLIKKVVRKEIPFRMIIRFLGSVWPHYEILVRLTFAWSVRKIFRSAN